MNFIMINCFIWFVFYCVLLLGDFFWVGKELLESGFFVVLGFVVLGFDLDGIDDVYGLVR